MAASLLFDVYGPSGIPIKSNFTPATLKTQSVNYFRFGIRHLKMSTTCFLKPEEKPEEYTGLWRTVNA
jgi:hypothetical protein